MPRTPLEAYAFDPRFGKRSVFILDPRLKYLTTYQYFFTKVTYIVEIHVLFFLHF